METVHDFDSVKIEFLSLKSRGPTFNGVETLDIECDEQGPMYLANAAPVLIVKGVRTDNEGREFVIIRKKDLDDRVTAAFNAVAEQLSILGMALMGYAPVFGGDSAAFGLTHDFKMYDKEGSQCMDYKNKSGHYRIMYTLDTAVIRDNVLMVMPKIQQMQFMEEAKQAFDRCYWVPPLKIKVGDKPPKKRAKKNSSMSPEAKKPAKKETKKLLAERRMRESSVLRQVDQHAGLGLEERANLS